MGFPSYARNRARALPSPSPFHYVMAKIVPVLQLAAHAKSSTLYGRTTKFFGLDGLLLFCIQLFQFTLSDQSLKPTRQDRRGIWDLNE